MPLVLHDEVIGTFNVESPEPRAFQRERPAVPRDLHPRRGRGLNTLELLVAEKASTAAESVEAIHSAVALPVDEILNDAVNVMERYIGHEPEVVERLQRILRNARDIKQVIQKVGQKMAPTAAHPQPFEIEQRPALRSRRVLVVDADESVRSAAHDLLERYGCVVETAHDGEGRVHGPQPGGPTAATTRSSPTSGCPTCPATTSWCQLQGLIVDPVPLVLMTGFGYDPGHSIVKARQAGLQSRLLFKPFRLDQLLEIVESVIRQAAS